MKNGLPNKKLLFSLSKSKGDFIVQPFKGSGNGGQKKNKTMSGCRITHPKSGAVTESQSERSFSQNKKIAFKRLLKTSEFLKWHKLETAKYLGKISDIETEVDNQMKQIKVEVFKNGEWKIIE